MSKTELYVGEKGIVVDFNDNKDVIAMTWQTVDRICAARAKMLAEQPPVRSMGVIEAEAKDKK